MTEIPTASSLLDRLRSEPHPASAYVVPLASMVFLRWADFQEAEAEAMAAFDESEFTPLLPASLHWRRWHDFLPEELKRFFAHDLPDAIERLGASHDSLAASLRRLLPAIRSCGELSPRALIVLTDWLALQSFETPNDRRRLLETFDAILDRASSRDYGQFRTPACINDLLVALAAPAPGERLYDPCFGFAGNLTAACRRVQQTEQPGFARTGVPPLLVVGVENNADAFAVGLARLVLAGVADPQLELGNSLEREGASNPRKEGFELIICNPPWGGRLDLRGMDHFPIQTNDSTGLFVQHALSQLRPDGRAVIVVPQGLLFQQGKPAALRQWLLEHHRVDAIVSLPAGAFMPYTSVKAAILVLRRNGGPTRRVRMVDAIEYFESGKGREPGRILPARIEELAAAVRDANPTRQTWDIEAATLAELDYDLTPARRDKSVLEEILESLGKEIPVLSLKEVCRISTGTAIKSAGLSNEPQGENPVPYVRIGDIHRGQATKGKSWVTPEALAEVGPRFRLRAGDVLVSRSGTIGKSGVVRNGAVGGVATNGFFVLTPDDGRIDPHYLAAYLTSSECNAWLQSRSGGSTIKGLQKRFIEDLPVPVPPLVLQHRVAADVREHGVDALTQLGLLLTRTGDDPLAQWIDRSMRQLIEDHPGSGGDTSQVVRLRIFGPGFDAVREWIAPASDPPPLLAWAENLLDVADGLQGSAEVPRGPSFLSMLQRGVSDLGFAEQQIKGHSPLESKAREMTRKCIERLEQAEEHMFASAHVVIEAKSASLVAGVRQEVSFLVRNEGLLPLRKFVIKSPEWGFTCQAVFLAESEERVITVEVTPPSETGNHPMVVEWSAVGLDGRPLGERLEFSFHVGEHAPSADSADLGHSPYFISQPVGPDRNDVFFGREEVIEQIKRQIQSGNTVLLEGNRRAGKSSILKHLEGKDRIPGWLAVYSSFQGATGDDRVAGMKTEAVWRTLAQSLAGGLLSLGVDVPLPDGTTLKAGTGIGVARACRTGISAEAPWEDFQDYLATVLKMLDGLDRGLVLMIDEFDKLQEGIDNGVTSPQIPENIRFLIQTQPRFSAVLTGSRRMQRLRNEYWSALYGLGNRIGVTALDDASARLLVTKPVAGRLFYSAEALDLVVALTARQPFLIQYLCNRIFEFANHAGQRSVTISLVKEAAEAFVEDNEHFASLWGYAETDRRRYLIALCHREGNGPDPLTFGVIQERLAGVEIEVSNSDLDADLKCLLELELIEYLGAGSGGRYRLTIPLMGQWLDSQQDYDALLAKALAEQQNQL